MEEKFLRFYLDLEGIKDHRYKSWERCCDYFHHIRDKRLTEQNIELASLHLAFYLASWGMYRGSGFILQKDYTIFKEIVSIILDNEFSILWDVEGNIDNAKELSSKFSVICNKIKCVLEKTKGSLKYHHDLGEARKRFSKDGVSKTLITKILLGTVGCIPAYDRYFMLGLKINKIQQRFDPDQSLLQWINFYVEHKQKIDSLKSRLGNNKYTTMKIIDMWFWFQGLDDETRKKTKS